MAHAITRDPETMRGTPVFRGTRVPAQTLFEYLEGGETLDDFLGGFPTVASVTCCRLFRREDSIALDQKRRGSDDLPVGALAKVDPLPSCRREVDLRKRKRLTISTGSCQWNETRSALRIRGLLRPHWRWIRHLRPTIAGTMNAFKASNCCRFNISMNVDLR